MWGKQWTLSTWISPRFSICFPSLLLEKLMCYGLDKWSVRWVGNWLTGHTQRVVVNSSFSNWQSVTSRVPQGSILGPLLFNIFISDLEDGMKCTLMKCANDTKLSGEVDTWEGRTTLQENLDRPEEWTNKNLMKFNKDKCKVLHLWKHNPGVQHRLGKGPGGPGGQWAQHERTVSCCGRVNRMLSRINKGITSRDKEVIIPLYSVPCQASPGILCSVLVLAIWKRCGQAQEGLQKGHKDHQRTVKPAIWGKAERTGFWGKA